MDSKTQANLHKEIRKRFRKVKDPAGRDLNILDDNQATELAYKCHCKVLDIYIEAMTHGIYPYRYIRNKETLSLQEQLRLAKSRVTVVGAGGLGSHVILLLARLGVGHLVVVDHDMFDETNLNRQVLCNQTALNKSKTEQAVSVVGSVNQGVEVVPHPVKLNTSNAFEILAGSDTAVDALDNLPDRLILEQATQNMGIPLVHGALAGFEGWLMTIFPDDSGLKTLYGNKRTNGNKSKDPEAVLGIPGITPSLIATLQAMEVIKIILKRGKILRNTMVHVDLENGDFNRFVVENHVSSEDLESGV